LNEWILMFIHVILNNNGKPLKPCSGSAISCLINLMNTFIQFASWKYIINGTDMIVPTWVTDIKRELLHCSIYRRCHCWNMTVIFTTIKHNSLHVYDCYGVRFYFTSGVRFILRQVYDLFYVRCTIYFTSGVRFILRHIQRWFSTFSKSLHATMYNIYHW